MNPQHLFQRCIILTSVLTLTLTPSCSWFKKDPMYIGTWENRDKIYVSDKTFNTITTLKLTESTFEEVYIIKRDNSSEVVSLLGMKGNLEVKGDEMTFRLTAVGECVKDNQQNCTSAVEWFKKGSPQYNTYVQYLEETVKGKFEADEDYLWLLRDRNLDGDTDDAGEEMWFERL